MASPDIFVTEVEHNPAVALLRGVPAYPLSSPRRANLGNQAAAVSHQSASASLEPPVLAEQPSGKLRHDRTFSERHQAVDILAHELTEALCAVTNYLRGAQILAAANDPAGGSKLSEAIANALAQTSRACSVDRHRRELEMALQGRTIGREE